MKLSQEAATHWRRIRASEGMADTEGLPYLHAV